MFSEFTILCSTTAKYSSGLHISLNGHNVCKYVFQAVPVWLVTTDVELYPWNCYLYFLYMTELEINFDLILLYLNLLGLHVIIIIENINHSQKYLQSTFKLWNPFWNMVTNLFCNHYDHTETRLKQLFNSKIY